MILMTECHVWNHSIFALSTVRCFKKLKPDVNGRGLLPIPQVNNNRNSYIVGPKKMFDQEREELLLCSVMSTFPVPLKNCLEMLDDFRHSGVL
jgi:hypothetical protein